MKTIIIEDEELFTLKLKNHLESEEFLIETSQNVNDGEKKIKEHQPDIVFLDNFLPGKEGVSSIELLKKTAPDIKVIFMSSSFDITLVTKAIENGADFLLNKRQNLNESLAPILNAIRNTRTSNNSIKETENHSESKFEGIRRIAIIEDEETFSLQLNWILNSLSMKPRIRSFTNSFDFMEALINGDSFDYLFSDLYLDETTIKEIMPFIQTKIPDAKTIILSSQPDVNDAIDLKNLGIYNFIEKNENWKVNFLNTLKSLGFF